MHCPPSSAKNIREALAHSLMYARNGGCCTPTTDSQSPSPVESPGCPSSEPFSKHVNLFRDSVRRYSELDPLTVDSFTQKLEDHEQLSTGNRPAASSLPPRRNCRTPDVMTSSSNFLYSHSIEPEADCGSFTSLTAGRWGGASFDHGQVFKRCQYLEAEVEYLRDREQELRDRVELEQSEKAKMAEELKALDERHHDALNAKRTVQEAYSDQKQSFTRLHAAYTQKVQEVKELTITLDRERMHWMESLQAVQEELDQVRRQRNDMYRNTSHRPSVFTDTTDTDISLNDFFEDVSQPLGADFQTGNLSSSVNNSPRVSPRNFDDIREENKRLAEENKKLRAECEELEACRKVYQQKQKMETLKQDGNKAFQLGKYEQALKCYSAALERVDDDPHMKAVLHCNKAAALYNMENFLGAIVSCCCAIDCDASYLRAYQRRASAYEAISDFSSAARDLTYIINAGSSATVAREAQLHLTELQRKLKRSKNVDACKILGLSVSATTAEIKSQYRRLALTYHPDKALDQPGAAEVFKLISEAHSLLLDESNRRRLDACQVRSSRSPRGDF